MRKLVEDVEGEGLESLLGKNVMLFCMNYIYTGKLIGVNTTCIKLRDPRIVYETGAFTDKNFKDAQALPFDMYIQTSAIEAFGETDKR